MDKVTFLQKWCTSFDLETIDNYVPSDKKLSLIINYIYLTMFLNVQLHVKVAVRSYYPFKFYLFAVTVLH